MQPLEIPDEEYKKHASLLRLVVVATVPYKDYPEADWDRKWDGTRTTADWDDLQEVEEYVKTLLVDAAREVKEKLRQYQSNVYLDIHVD